MKLSARIAMLVGLVLMVGALPARAENLSAEVVEVDREASCLLIDWNDDTRKKVCWSPKTVFSELDSGDARTAADLRPGSYLRIEGEEDGEVFRATEIVIWEAASQP